MGPAAQWVLWELIECSLGVVVWVTEVMARASSFSHKNTHHTVEFRDIETTGFYPASVFLSTH
jgi:hypothetical protein